MSDQSSNRFVDSLRLFADIARLRRGPEDLPVDRSLLTMTVLVFGLLNVAFTLILPNQTAEGREQALALVLLDIVVTLVSLHFLLQVAKRPERFRQTAAATFGFQIVMAPALQVATWLSILYGKDKTWQLPVALLHYALAVWVLAVTARILRAATGWSMAACVGLIITLQLFMFLLFVLLFPATLAQLKPAQS